MPKKREILQEITFNDKNGTFENMYAAFGWLTHSGFSYGSTDRYPNPVAIQKGEYTLPQKWHNFTAKQKSQVDGIITSNDWREGEVKVIIYK
jgi:hypothetical protein